MLRPVPVDGSPDTVAELVGALGSTLDGTGPAVLPVGPAGRDRPVPEAAPAPGTAVVITTSGSTGEPKHVMLTGTALTASARATEARLGGPARWLLALPADHVAGVQVIVRALLAGAAPVVQDVRDGFRSADFARATARMPWGARRYTSLVPTQLLRLLDAGGAPLHALCGYDAVLVGGAALDAGLRARAEAAGVRIVATYGMSETAGGCVYDGLPLDGVAVRLDGGRILLGGPTLAAGYLGRPAETAAVFADGWFRTGDLGRWAGPRLEVLGRADDVIVTGGEKIAPAAVERVLAAQPGVRAACAVGLPDPEWGEIVAAVLVLADPAATPDSDRLGAAVRSELGRAAVPRRLLAVDELPLRGVGKPDRIAVRRLLTATD
ncbi:o-succinylbenzoate--CoA ligase [Pseudonocardia bannensis]|uniref:o-succinylbenzoate--CoA ligase n=1 Tax=Pseudonocardia bannensis TaxID=630973 RepID=UPI001B7D1F15|nr:o-succinylbenzoate--CoA ligase [Pseudonocardia bannensis]